jgi:microcystin-dependent protein
MFAGNFAPRGWAFCDGRILSISTNSALFSILGTTYGGNGTTTFALPDLRGRAPIHAGQGPGLSNRTLGEMGGTESVALTQNQMPTHSHQANAFSGEGTSTSPQNNVWAGSAQRDSIYTNNPNTTMSPSAVSPAGGGQPHGNMPPYGVVNYIIALEGVFPPRD